MKGLATYLSLVIVGIFLVVVYRYYDYVVNKNFFLEVATSCSPTEHRCFISECSPSEDPGCLGVPYQKIKIKASEAPSCLEEHSCDNFTCLGIQSCIATYCSDEFLTDGESCSEEARGATETEITADIF